MTSPDDYDQRYYEANGQIGDRPALTWYARLARRYLGTGKALDVGCGTGHLLKRLARQQGGADGLEISEFSAASARQTSPTSTVFTSPSALPQTRYARFTAIHVVEHLDDATLRGLLQELRRSSTDGARYLVVTPDSSGRAEKLHGASWNAYSDPTHINLKSHQEWRSYFETEGFEVLREGSDGMWNVPYSSLPRPLDALRHSMPMAVQFLTGRLFVKPGAGESSVFVLKGRSSGHPADQAATSLQ